MNDGRLLPIGGAVAALVLMAGGCGSSNDKTNSTTTARSSFAAGSQTTTTVTSTGAAGVVSGSVGAVSATLRAASHHPKVQAPWPIGFTVTRAGHPAHASVSYEYLFAGQVVARRSHYTFDGRFSDTFHWPSAAVGYPLTFRAVIVCEGATINLDYPVQVVA